MLNVITSFFQNFNALENILEFWHSDVGYPWNASFTTSVDMYRIYTKELLQP